MLNVLEYIISKRYFRLLLIYLVVLIRIKNGQRYIIHPYCHQRLEEIFNKTKFSLIWSMANLKVTRT
ncbi:hypothetical protein RIR_jg31263.t1 [Rhizophagus irregularis DAOM 181602=DAOM 197198]|nr:hypothetical protein RIR_jg31263.t1 [Rhizophagus irregularis DAOM 181602=DAOM 197198]